MFKKTLSLVVIVCFFLTTLGPIPQAHADTVPDLPQPGTMVNLSPAYEPALIKGLTVHKDNPFLFDFILDTGNDPSLQNSSVIASEAKVLMPDTRSSSQSQQERLKQVGDRLVKYFFACLTIPEKDLWVNLSPYEKDRMVPNALGQTTLGRDLLAQDYILKQLTASLIYPEKNLGKEFWDRVYAKAQQMYGTTQIPVNTFNKVWIVADKASVYEHGQTAFVVSGHLKVMLEEDYLALQKHEKNVIQENNVILSEAKDLNRINSLRDSSATPQNDTHSVASNIVRQIILPEIEKEVNTGKNFASLHQILNSLILANWYKNNLKEALLNQVYADKSTVKGIQRPDVILSAAKDLKAPLDSSAMPQNDVEIIYQQYLKAYKKGVFNYIKEDTQPDGQTIPRKYFSGGFGADVQLTVSHAMSALEESHIADGNDFAMKVVLNIKGTDQAMIKDREGEEVMVLIDNKPTKGKILYSEGPWRELVHTVQLLEGRRKNEEVKADDNDIREAERAAKQAGIKNPAMIHEDSEILVRVKGFEHLKGNVAAQQFVVDSIKELDIDPNDVEVIDRSDDARLFQEEAKENPDGFVLLNNGKDYYARFNPKDTARSVERTFVATDNEDDQGKYNNWRKASQLKQEIMKKLQGSYKGKKVYVIPYLMGPVNSEFSQVGIQITDSRYVAISTIRMAKVGEVAMDHLNGEEDPGDFVRGIHSTGDLDEIHRLKESHKIDERYFASFPDERMILSFGSGYGGNVLFGKKFQALRQAMRDGLKNGWLAEHMFILEVEDLQGEHKGRKRYIAGAFPSASGKTNTSFIKVPVALKDQYATRVIGDDIAWMRRGKDGRIYAVNPEDGAFGVIYGTGDNTNENFMQLLKGPSAVIYTNVAYNPITREVWWEDKDKGFPSLKGNGKYWRDWKGDLIINREVTQADVDKMFKKRRLDDLIPDELLRLKAAKGVWAHKNSRATASLSNGKGSVVSPELYNPNGVPISVILWGGRNDHEPLIRQLPDSRSGIYDGLTMVIEATAAAEGLEGKVMADPFAQLPFFSIHETDYVRNQDEVLGQLNHPPAQFHVNWFRRDDKRKFMWPGFSDNFRVLLWALERVEGKGDAVETPIGAIPIPDAINLKGLEGKVSKNQLIKLLGYDPEFWRQEVARQTDFLHSLESENKKFPGFIWDRNKQLRQKLGLDSAMTNDLYVEMKETKITDITPNRQLMPYWVEDKVITVIDRSTDDVLVKIPDGSRTITGWVKVQELVDTMNENEPAYQAEAVDHLIGQAEINPVNPSSLKLVQNLFKPGDHANIDGNEVRFFFTTSTARDTGFTLDFNREPFYFFRTLKNEKMGARYNQVWKAQVYKSLIVLLDGWSMRLYQVKGNRISEFPQDQAVGALKEVSWLQVNNFSVDDKGELKLRFRDGSIGKFDLNTAVPSAAMTAAVVKLIDQLNRAAQNQRIGLLEQKDRNSQVVKSLYDIVIGNLTLYYGPIDLSIIEQKQTVFRLMREYWEIYGNLHKKVEFDSGDKENLDSMKFIPNLQVAIENSDDALQLEAKEINVKIKNSHEQALNGYLKVLLNVYKNADFQVVPGWSSRRHYIDHLKEDVDEARKEAIQQMKKDGFSQSSVSRHLLKILNDGIGTSLFIRNNPEEEKAKIDPSVEKEFKSNAMTANAVFVPQETRAPGGIDLNTANMGMTVTKDAQGGVKVTFDPAMIERIRAQGVQSADPVIISVTPMSAAEIRPLLGFNAKTPKPSVA